MRYSVTSSEKTKEVQYLIDHIPDETMRDMKNAIEDGILTELQVPGNHDEQDPG